MFISDNSNKIFSCRNVKVNFVENPHELKKNNFQNYKYSYIIHTWSDKNEGGARFISEQKNPDLRTKLFIDIKDF